MSSEPEQMRTVKCQVTEDHAQWLESVTKMPINELSAKLLNEYFDDHRRRTIAVSIVGIAWQPELYTALVHRTVALGVSVGSYIRETIHTYMKRKSPVFATVPAVNDTGPKEVNETHEAYEGRKSVVVPIRMPETWWNTLKEMGYQSGNIKAWVQIRLEGETKKTYPVQKGQAKFLDDPYLTK